MKEDSNDKLFTYFVLATKRYINNKTFILASHIALNMILSLFPTFIFILSITAYARISAEQIIEMISFFTPYEIGSLIETNIHNITTFKSPTLVSISILTTLFSASRGYKAVILGINTAYGVKNKHGFIRNSIFAILFIIMLSFIIILALLLLVLGQTLWNVISNALNLSVYSYFLWTVIRYLGTFLILYFGFLLLFTKASSLKLTLKDGTYGALFTTSGWFIVSYLFSFYVDNFGNYANIYGGIAGIFILILWFNLMASIMLLGVELNAVLYYRELKK